ncbi:MAG: transcriptional regulator [Dehalococcoidia bacterium]
MPVSPDFPEYIRPRACLHALTPARRAVVETLKRTGEQTVEQLAQRLAVSASAIRQHLNFLMSQDLVGYAETLPQGRGRPRRLFRLTARGEELFPNRSGDLALRLLSELARTNPELVAAAVEARLAEDTRWFTQEFERISGPVTANDLVRIYDDMAFGPILEECGGGRSLLMLAHCPVREMAALAPGLCELELEGLHQLLPGCAVRRVRHRLRGDPECAFVIEERVEVASCEEERAARTGRAHAAG